MDEGECHDVAASQDGLSANETHQGRAGERWVSRRVARAAKPALRGQFPSRQMPRTSCIGRSEIENSTDSFGALCEWRAHGGITNTSFGPHSRVWSPTLVVPPPSTHTKMVPSVER